MQGCNAFPFTFLGLQGESGFYGGDAGLGDGGVSLLGLKPSFELDLKLSEVCYSV